MALPFSPGYVFDKNLGKFKFHKSHHFDLSGGVKLNVGEEKPGIGGERLPSQRLAPQHSYIPRGTVSGTDLPAWVAFDKQVLAFDAYFQQEAVESRELEQYSVRKVKLYFYLEDDSLQIVEPRVTNSGLTQGTLVRRHRVPRPYPNDAQYFTVEDLNLGAELNIYATVYKLVNCDAFTHNFLSKLGVRVAPPVQVPADPHTQNRKAELERCNPLRAYDKVDTRAQFLAHDRHVLRFYGHWDDREELFGDEHHLILHYFLADDTVELIEKVPVNSGRDVVPWFVHRAPLPKVVEPLRRHGEVAPRTLLNVMAPPSRQVHGQVWILDPLKMGEVKQEFYRDTDLTIGAVINAWGRKLVLYDCDNFTKEYYRVKYGITDFTPLHIPKPSTPKVQREIPPYNGFGSEEDSLGYCLRMLPKPPQRDFHKFMAYDRRGYESNVLRFQARLDTDLLTELDRRFVISYFRTDDTIAIFEPPIRNSGRTAGKFLERGRVKKPGQERYGVELSQYYTGDDLYIGAKLSINQHRFILIEADEYVYDYMEKNHEQFVQSDVSSILARVRDLVRCREEEVRAHCPPAPAPGAPPPPPITFKQFVAMLCSLTDGQISDHDVITLGRRYRSEQKAGHDVEWVLLQIQTFLKKNAFEDFGAILDQCIHHDGARCGRLEKYSVHAVFKALRVPLLPDMLETLLDRMARPEDKSICYAELLRCIDWRHNPLPFQPHLPDRFDPDWVGGEPPPSGAHFLVHSVNVRAFLDDLIGCPPAPRPRSPPKCCEV